MVRVMGFLTPYLWDKLKEALIFESKSFADSNLMAKEYYGCHLVYPIQRPKEAIGSRI
jgi:hypothetical protein